ncbi:VIT domain-containing protein [Agarilytica rhodophyticola]|uniref:VIT domain-containing protein n=1 Tax=Agarilytica rhodophyticola TaxID=1737490 RepID=UPI000B343969|nr:VIT domain-containing protein [Agarilytica rhodophyticola]
MTDYISPQLATPAGELIPLKEVDIEAKIEGLMTDVTLTQHYKNKEHRNIEVVYTFQLPIDAVLLSLEVIIDGRVLTASIIEKKQAQTRYEDAITDGDTAIMLEQLEEGMYTMNIGNLMPDGDISIALNYAFIQRWQGNSLRLFIPTTIAQRYGHSSFSPHQVPESNIYAKYSYQFYLKIIGALSKANIASPTHALGIVRDDDSAEVIIKEENTLMDRDFILTLESEEQHHCGVIGQDGDNYCVLASFHPRFEMTSADAGKEKQTVIQRMYQRFSQNKKPDEQGRNITIVVDCSGSMAGVSIQQTRIALSKIVKSLSHHEFFNIILFGTDHHPLFNTTVQAKPRNKTFALHEIEKLEANMGGTNIGPALKYVYQEENLQQSDSDILLITDGRIYGQDAIFAQAKNIHHRIFTVGVGSAVSENFVRTLASMTGGACELVSPNENMAQSIIRHFSRMRQPGTDKVEIKWSQDPLYQQNIGAVYHGDTVNVFAEFAKEPANEAQLRLHMSDGKTLTQQVDLCSYHDTGDQQVSAPYYSQLSRLAAAQRIRSCDNKEEIIDIACRYQLMSPYTNCLMVDKRENPAEDLPVLRKVPQVASADYLAPGAMIVGAAPSDVDKLIMKSSPPPRSYRGESGDDLLGSSGIPDALAPESFDSDPFAISGCALPGGFDSDPFATAGRGLAEGSSAFNPSIFAFAQTLANYMKSEPFNYDELTVIFLSLSSLHPTIAQQLTNISHDGTDENKMCLFFIYHLFESCGEKINLNRQLHREITKAYKDVGLDDQLKDKISHVINEYMSLQRAA